MKNILITLGLGRQSENTKNSNLSYIMYKLINVVD